MVDPRVETFKKSHRIIGALSQIWASLVAQTVKNLPAVQETWA